MLCIIDAMEGREVETDNIPGAFLQTDYDKGDIYISMGVGDSDSTGGYLPSLIQGFHISRYP